MDLLSSKCSKFAQESPADLLFFKTNPEYKKLSKACRQVFESCLKAMNFLIHLKIRKLFKLKLDVVDAYFLWKKITFLVFGAFLKKIDSSSHSKKIIYAF